MTTPLTITSLSQGRLNAKPKSDAEYWARFGNKSDPGPVTGQPNVWHAARAAWQRLTGAPLASQR